MQFQIKLLIYFFCCAFSLNGLSNTNNNGQVGYINTPSAFTLNEQDLIAAIYRGEPERRIYLTASPFDWMDATLFYVDITGKEYGSGFKQSYKDKGFNLKLKIKEKGQLPAISIGFNDLAGTG